MTLEESIQGFRLRVLQDAAAERQCECDVSAVWGVAHAVLSVARAARAVWPGRVDPETARAASRPAAAGQRAGGAAGDRRRRWRGRPAGRSSSAMCWRARRRRRPGDDLARAAPASVGHATGPAGGVGSAERARDRSC